MADIQGVDVSTSKLHRYVRTRRGRLLGALNPNDAPLRRASPFLVAMLAGFIVVHLQAQGGNSPTFLAALALGALLVACIPVVPWARLPSMALVLPPLLLVGIVAFMRETSSDSEALTPLILLPVLWLALYGNRTGVAIGLGAVGLALFVPFLATSDATILPGERQSAVMWLLVAALTGVAVNGLVRDLRDRARELEETSRLDPLTGLGNRRTLERELPIEIRRARALEYPICVAMLDLDHFKLFNDRFGHLAGDGLLEEVSERWSCCLRSHDTLVRYGGEEFCCVLPNVDIEAATRIADRLRDVVPDDQTVSIGIAQVTNSESYQGAIARADAALYKAKSEGRNRIAASTAREHDVSDSPARTHVGAHAPEAA